MFLKALKVLVRQLRLLSSLEDYKPQACPLEYYVNQIAKAILPPELFVNSHKILAIL